MPVVGWGGVGSPVIRLIFLINFFYKFFYFFRTVRQLGRIRFKKKINYLASSIVNKYGFYKSSCFLHQLFVLIITIFPLIVAVD